MSIKKSNPYDIHLIAFYEKLIELLQASFRINNVLQKDVAKYSKDKNLLFVGTKIAVRDWTYPIGNPQNYGGTGVDKIMLKENYASKVEKIISRECCLTFAQSVENLETLFKDFMVQKYTKDEDFRRQFKCEKESFREHLRKNKNLFRALKIASKENFECFSRSNYYSIPFSEFWTVIKETRHAITHSNQRLKKSTVAITRNHFQIFEMLFDYKESKVEGSLLLKMNSDTLKSSIDLILGFSFQIYKAISLEEKLPFSIRVKNKDGKKLSDTSPELAHFLEKL